MITYEHHKQRIKDYKQWIHVNQFRLKVCSEQQIQNENLRAKHKRLLEKLEIYIQEALDCGYYELIV